jgi:streptogramin lyase
MTRRGLAVAVVMVVAACSAPAASSPSASQPSAASPSAASPTWQACDLGPTGQGLPPDPVPPPPDEEIATLTVVREISVARDPVSLAFGAGSLWVASVEHGTISRIDPAAGQVVDQFELGYEVGFPTIRADDTAAWVAGADDQSLTRIDASGLTQTATSLGPPVQRPYGIGLGAGSLWVSSQTGQTVMRIDPEQLEIEATIDVRPAGAETADFAPSSVAVDENGVWVVEHRGLALTRIDPASNTVVSTTCLGSPGPGQLVAHDGAVWIGEAGADVVSRVSTASEDIEVRLVTPGPVAASLATGNGAIWVATGSHLVEIDPSTNVVAATVLLTDVAPTDQYPGGLAVAFGGGFAWITHPTEDVILQVAAGPS